MYKLDLEEELGNSNIHWIIEKTREFQKNICFCFIGCTKAFDCVDHNKLWNILKEMGVPDHLTCLLRNLYKDQKATFRTLLEQLIGSELRKGYSRTICSHPVYLILYAEHIMRNAGVNELQVGIKIDCGEKHQQPQIFI